MFLCKILNAGKKREKRFFVNIFQVLLFDFLDMLLSISPGVPIFSRECSKKNSPPRKQMGGMVFLSVLKDVPAVKMAVFTFGNYCKIFPAIVKGVVIDMVHL
jgi:hypothetical protein